MIRVVLFCLLLSGCAIHATNFDCGPAKGVRCTPLHVVDEMVSSGDIEKLDLDMRKQKKCRVCK